MPELKITPNPCLSGKWLTFIGTGFSRTITRLYLDDIQIASFKPANNNTFTVGEISSITPKTQTLVAKQKIRGVYVEVARATVTVQDVVVPPPPPPPQLPTAPTNLTATKGDKKVILVWT